MATKVNFHSLSESAYEAATKADGGLYFISDNGEIRRGSQHVTGTRVFTATADYGDGVDDLIIKIDGQNISSTNPQLRVDFTYAPQEGTGWSGTVYLDETSSDSGIWEYVDGEGDDAITYRVSIPQGNESWQFQIEKNEAILDQAISDGNDPTSETMTYYNDGTASSLTGTSKMSLPEQPKKGDVLIVTTPLGDGKNETSAYIYSRNGGTYDVDGWQACDGNVDASKVILTNDITMAGNYDKIGNFTKSTSGKKTNFIDNDTKGTSGVSVYELIRQMLSKTIEPTWQRNPPTASLSASSGGTKEQGEQASSTFTATFNDAYAKYTGGNNQMAGCTVDTNGYHFDGAETGQSGNTVTKTWIAGVDTAPSASVTIDYKASTNTIKNNLDEASTSISPTSIAAGTTSSASATASVTVIRYWFSGVDTVGTATIDSDFIRNLTKEGSATAADNHQFIVGNGAKRIIVAIPKSSALSGAKTLKNVFLVSASNTPLEINDTTTTGYKKLANPVSVADARENAGYIDYDVWVYQPASISPTEEHNIVIG